MPASKELDPRDVDDEKQMCNRNWNKMCRDLELRGYREGALVGNEESFSTGFLHGYKEGFAKSYEESVTMGRQRLTQLYTNNITDSKHITISRT